MSLPLLLLLLFCFLLAAAAVQDATSLTISNWFSVAVLLTGLFCVATQVDIGTWWEHGASFVITLAGGILLFSRGLFGGGDVKLLAALGAWLGPWPTLYVFAITAIIGMVFVLAQAAVQGRLGKLLRNSTVIAMSLASSDQNGLDQAMETGQACSGNGGKPLPYAVPVLLATLIALARM